MASAVDASTLRKLGEDLGADHGIMRELIDTFLGEAPRVVAAMVAGARAGSRSEVNRAAHSLKSTAATFGAGALAQLCRDLERDTEKELPPDTRPRADAVAAEWARVEAELRKLRP